MTDFLIKSSISLVALLAVYYLFLEKEKMHRFNRFYLLFSLVFSLVLPFITIEMVQDITQPTVNPGNIQIVQGSVIAVEETNYLAIGLWSLYGLVTLVLAIRFFSNINKIWAKMKSNTPIVYKNAQLILVPEKTLPHTFLNTIFINETEYNNRDRSRTLPARTNACNSKAHARYFIHQAIENGILVQPYFYFL